jgi:23S rRNA (guanine745-N1)-methyltransferase
MPPLNPKPAYSILRCPVCRLELAPAHRSLACSSGHSFDIARTGYVNLLSGRRGLPSAGGDARQRILRRASFLDRGHFDFISGAIVHHLETKTRPDFGPEFYILDAGCGTGHHLVATGNLLRAAGANWHGLGIDISKEAISFASRHTQSSAFAVSDIWQDWPVRTTSVDLLISIFAPRNFKEMARVLCADGLLALAYPGPSHLVELRREFPMLGIPAQKSARYVEAARKQFVHTSIQYHRGRAILSRDEILDATLMGPSANKVIDQVSSTEISSMEVTFDIEILFAWAR